MEASSPKKPRALHLKIILDTNQLFTKSASELLRLSLKRIIEESYAHKDIRIEWIIPELVLNEREYQILNEAKDILPSIKKIERLLGHNLGINEDTLRSRVRETISRQICEMRLTVTPLNVSSVDWNKIVMAAVFRKPPFEEGEKEKGFRDALIAECCLQAIQAAPKSRSVCRIVVVTGDGLLADYIEELSAGHPNAQVIRNLDDLQGLINTLISDVTEQFVAGIKEASQKAFFSKDSKDGLYYKEKIHDIICEDFGDKLNEIPKGASSRENGVWYIGPTSFIVKKGQRIFWRTTISVESTAYRLESQYPIEDTKSIIEQPKKLTTVSTPFQGIRDMGFGSQILRQLNLSSSRFLVSNILSGSAGFLSPNISGTPEKIVLAKGQSVFYVTWSVIITTTHKLYRPKISSIEWQETTWN